MQKDFRDSSLKEFAGEKQTGPVKEIAKSGTGKIQLSLLTGPFSNAG